MPDAPATADLADAEELRIEVPNKLGLHARPAARFVETASRFDATVTVADETTGRGPADARSLSALITLGVRQGHEILVRAAGPQADAALAALRELAGRRLRRRERRRTRHRAGSATAARRPPRRRARSSGVPAASGHRDRARPPTSRGSDPFTLPTT